MQQFIQMILDYKILDSHQLKPFNMRRARLGRAALPVMTAVTRFRDIVTPSLSGRVTRVTLQQQRAGVAGPSRLTLNPGPDRGRD